MVVKRQCSFCAREIEPGTGTMFVKRDGTVFHFCSSSCRKQQLDLGRLGHRFKWTRAYELKRSAARAAPTRGAAAAPTPGPVAAAPSAPRTPAAAAEEAEAAEPAEAPAVEEAEPKATPAPRTPKKTSRTKVSPTRSRSS